MMMDINVAVIGVGSMGRNHARVYSEIANLVAVADKNRNVAKQVAKQFGVDYYTNHKELLDADVDAVSVATPTSTHFKIALDVINAGKHLLVEKPICDKLNDAKKLIASAQQQGIVLAVGHIERHNRIVQYTKNAILKNEFGKLISILSRRVSSRTPRIDDIGVIHDLGVHEIDVQKYLVNSDVVSVYALGGSTSKTVYEDYANVLVSFENGVCGFIEVNWLVPIKVRKCYLTCTKKFVELDYITQTLQVASSIFMGMDVSNLYQVPQEFDIRTISLKKEEPLKNELTDFLNAIKLKKKPLVDGIEGLKVLKIADCIKESYIRRKKVDVK
jgi:UDP-N-acetylglucosamine 3-dehydrogenase